MFPVAAWYSSLAFDIRDVPVPVVAVVEPMVGLYVEFRSILVGGWLELLFSLLEVRSEIGRASCRERVL